MGDDVRLENKYVRVVWEDETRLNLTGTVKSVEDGKVHLEDGRQFENPPGIECKGASQAYTRKAWPCCALAVSTRSRGCALSAISVVTTETQSRNKDLSGKGVSGEHLIAGWITVKNMQNV